MTNVELAEKIYIYMESNEYLTDIQQRFNLSDDELLGACEILLRFELIKRCNSSFGILVRKTNINPEHAC